MHSLLLRNEGYPAFRGQRTDVVEAGLAYRRSRTAIRVLVEEIRSYQHHASSQITCQAHQQDCHHLVTSHSARSLQQRVEDSVVVLLAFLLLVGLDQTLVL